MTGIVWEGPQHARPAPWAGRRARGYGRTRGLRVDVRPGDQPVVTVGGENMQAWSAILGKAVTRLVWDFLDTS
jgi:hypothetical protein